MENDRGVGLAALRSPDYLATTSWERLEEQADGHPLSRFGGRAAIEATRRDFRLLDLEPVEEDEAAAREINDLFRRKLSGLRRLPRYERPHALRAAREWKRMALKALREKRATERHARRTLREFHKPIP